MQRAKAEAELFSYPLVPLLFPDLFLQQEAREEREGPEVREVQPAMAPVEAEADLVQMEEQEEVSLFPDPA